MSLPSHLDAVAATNLHEYSIFKTHTCEPVFGKPILRQQQLRPTDDFSTFLLSLLFLVAAAPACEISARPGRPCTHVYI
jgi:hypothetical protein